MDAQGNPWSSCRRCCGPDGLLPGNDLPPRTRRDRQTHPFPARDRIRRPWRRRTSAGLSRLARFSRRGQRAQASFVVGEERCEGNPNDLGVQVDERREVEAPAGVARSEVRDRTTAMFLRSRTVAMVAAAALGLGCWALLGASALRNPKSSPSTRSMEIREPRDLRLEPPRRGSLRASSSGAKRAARPRRSEDDRGSRPSSPSRHPERDGSDHHSPSVEPSGAPPTVVEAEPAPVSSALPQSADTPASEAAPVLSQPSGAPPAAPAEPPGVREFGP